MAEWDSTAFRFAEARSGSRQALGELLDCHRRYLLEVARQSIADDLRPKGGASDLVQETFLDAHRRFADFSGASAEQLRAWLRCLLVHRAAKLGRSFRGTTRRRLSLEMPLHPDLAAARQPTPSLAMMADERLGELQAAIERLPADYRDAVLLRYRRGLSFEEVGRQLDRSPDAARMLWSRAIERLRSEMVDDPAIR